MNRTWLNEFRHGRRMAGAVAAALAVVACGGGGGGGGDAPAPPAPSYVAITQANQEAVASAAAGVFVGFTGLSSVLTLRADAPVVAAGKSAPVQARPVVPALPAPGALLVRLPREAVLSALATKPAPGAMVRPQAVMSDTAACTDGGSMTVTMDDADNTRSLTAGDRLTISFAQCREGGDLMDGSLSMAFTRVAPTADGNSVSAAVSYGALTTQRSDFASTTDGAMTMTLNIGPGEVSTEISIAGGGVTTRISSLAPAYSETLTLAAGLSIFELYEPNAMLPGAAVTGRSSVQVNGDIAFTRVGGSVALRTLAPVRTYAAQIDPYPYEGRIMVSGGAGSRLQLTALDTATVRLELDADGNGSFELVTARPWTDLL